MFTFFILKMNRSIIKMTFIFLFIPFCSFAQKGSIKVIVKDTSAIKHPMFTTFNQSELKLISISDSTKMWEGKILKDGSFLLKNIPFGTYNLIFLNTLSGKKVLKGIEITTKETKQIQLAIVNRSAFGCHKCKSKDIVPITYGFSISEEEKKLGREGKLIWRGCVIGLLWFCKNCKSDI